MQDKGKLIVCMYYINTRIEGETSNIYYMLVSMFANILCNKRCYGMILMLHEALTPWY